MFKGNSKSKIGHEMEDYYAFKDGIAALADGHSNASGLAKYASNRIVEIMSQFKPDTDPLVIESAYKEAFPQIHKECEKFVCGGATLTSVFVGEKDGKKYVTVANVGDSPAFLFSDTFQELTTSHNPDNADEGKRIYANARQYDIAKTENGSWCSYNTINHDFTRFPIFDVHGNKIEYPETYAKMEELRNEWSIAYYDHQKDKTKEKHQISKEKEKAYKDFELIHKSSPDSQIIFSTVHPERSCYLVCPEGSLGITRSIGDHNYTIYGVICEPSVRTFYVEKPSYLFIASDGVADCFKYDEILSLIEKDETELLEIFCEKSKSLFEKQHDDISFVMAKID